MVLLYRHIEGDGEAEGGEPSFKLSAGRSQSDRLCDVGPLFSARGPPSNMKTGAQVNTNNKSTTKRAILGLTNLQSNPAMAKTQQHHHDPPPPSIEGVGEGEGERVCSEEAFPERPSLGRKAACFCS